MALKLSPTLTHAPDANSLTNYPPGFPWIFYTFILRSEAQMATFKFYGGVADPYEFGFGGGATLEQVELVEGSSGSITLINPYSYAKIVLSGEIFPYPQVNPIYHGRVFRLNVFDQNDAPIYSIELPEGSNGVDADYLLNAIRNYKWSSDSAQIDRAMAISWRSTFDASESTRPLSESDDWLPLVSEIILSPFEDHLRVSKNSMAAGGGERSITAGAGDVIYAGEGAATVSSTGATIHVEGGTVAFEGSGTVDFGSATTGRLRLHGTSNDLSLISRVGEATLKMDEAEVKFANAGEAFSKGMIFIDLTKVSGQAHIRLDEDERVTLYALDEGRDLDPVDLLTGGREQSQRGFITDLNLEGHGTVVLDPIHLEGYIDRPDLTPIAADSIVVELDVPGGTLQTNRFKHPDDIINIQVGKDVTLQVHGTTFADRLIGGAEKNIFLPSVGNDTIDGGEGHDVLRYEMEYEESLRPYNAHQLLVPDRVSVDLAAGVANVSLGAKSYQQIISNIEEVQGTAKQDTLIGKGNGSHLAGKGGDDRLYAGHFDLGQHVEESAVIYRLYQAVFDRAPDAAGHLSWTKALALGTQTLPSIAQAFTTSEEFRTTYRGLSDAGFVEQLYLNVLDRSADPQGLASWVRKIESGVPRHQVVLGFANSQEFISSLDDAAQDYAEGRNSSGYLDDVYRLYSSTLAREPDVVGLQTWLGHLSDGYNLERVAWSFVNAPEFTQTYGELNNRQFVELLYRNVLGREADPDGLEGWVTRLEAGYLREKIVLGFSQSSEYIAMTTPKLTAWLEEHPGDTLDGGAGNDQLYGGFLADTFVFRAADKGSDVVSGFEATDKLSFVGFGYESVETLRAQFSQRGDDVLFADQAVEVLIKDFRLEEISDAMLLI